jgi:translocation and assembly module TamB
MTVFGGRLSGSARLGLADDSFGLDVTGREVDVSGFAPGARGLLSFRLSGEGVLGRDPVKGKIEIRNPAYGSVAASLADGNVELLLSGESLSASWNGVFRPGENDCSLSFQYRFRERSYSADIKGSFTDLDILLPWKGARGQVNYLAEIRGPSADPRLKGVVDFQGTVLPIPDFSQAVTDYSGLVFLEGGNISLRSFQGTLGGGAIQGTGEMTVGPGGEVGLDATIEGRGMRLSPLERTRALADARLRLIRDSDRFVLEGDFDIQSLSWRRELSEEFVFSSKPFYHPSAGRGFFDDLTLNINLRAADNAWVENSLGRARGRFDLNVTGSVTDPILLGEVELLDGYVFFQDRKFTLLRGNLRFFSPMAVDPFLDFRGETYVKDYRVTFSLSGLLDHLRTEFSSSPPLPPEDVLALLVMGEAFKRTYRAETSSQLSSATLLTLQLFEEAKRRATKLLSIDRFRIDPFILGTSSEMTARLTVGKRISRNLFIYYSTNLATQREEIVRLEWELGDNLSLVGIRDDLGRVSLDFKIRKRF